MNLHEAARGGLEGPWLRVDPDVLRALHHGGDILETPCELRYEYFFLHGAGSNVHVSFFARKKWSQLQLSTLVFLC